MTGPPPVVFAWDGEAFHPASQYWAGKCDEHFVVGETYRLVPHEERSGASHRHFFACVNETWKNLPDEELELYPTAEHLRKKMLIKAGYRDERQIVCNTKTQAHHVAGFIRPCNDTAVVIVKDCVVMYYTAKSQSQRAMGRKEFQESKEKVMDLLAGLIGVERKALEASAGEAA